VYITNERSDINNHKHNRSIKQKQAGVLAQSLSDDDSLPTIVAGTISVFTMSVQNSASRTVLLAHGKTIVMTGNVTQWAIDSVDLMAAPKTASLAERMATI